MCLPTRVVGPPMTALVPLDIITVSEQWLYRIFGRQERESLSSHATCAESPRARYIVSAYNKKQPPRVHPSRGNFAGGSLGEMCV